jgi:hypothetical protein
MIKINSTQTGVTGPGDDKNKKTSNAGTKTEIKTGPVLKNDAINLSKAVNKENPVNSDVFSDGDGDKKPNGWKVKSVSLNAGYLVKNDVIANGPMHIVNPANGTDIRITNYKQIERTSWDYLTMKNGTRFAPDEPQFDLGVNVTFENNFGVELDVKHNKIIMDGYGQTVHFDGTMNGDYVNMDAPLNTFLAQHENTYGNAQISTLATYTIDLPAPANNRFSFITKAGPSLITTATNSWIKNPAAEGGYDHGGTSLNIAGFGGMLENGFRYQLGPKAGRVGLELTHSISYLNYASYPMTGGYTGSHSAVDNAFALKLTVGLYGNKK